MLPRRLALAGLLVLLLASPSLGAGLDKDGDGEVTADEFLGHDGKAAEGDESCSAPPPPAGEGGEGAGGSMDPAQLAAAKKAVDEEFAMGKPIAFDQAKAGVVLDGSMHAFLKFSTSWCGHCVKMQPDWEALAKTVHKDHKGCRIVSVDCEKDAEICQAFGVQGYPTLMLLKLSKTPEGEIGYEPVPYQEARDFGSMLGFLNKNGVIKAKNWLLPIKAKIMNLISTIFKIEVSMPK
mmetsp:Transcript_30046/g.76126  ORF Transcript_30046/g.76126 Transcript_30046/m.76126 type:complete len:236 (-) Transcript_30046:46-753(-)